MYDLIYSDPMDYNQAVKSAEYLIANDVEAQKMWIAKAPEGFPCPLVEGKRERRREADAFLTGVTQSRLYWEEWKAEKLARRVDGAEVPQGNDMERTSGDDSAIRNQGRRHAVARPVPHAGQAVDAETRV